MTFGRILWVLALLLWAEPGTAHPLGNNTVNRQAELHLSSDRVLLHYLVDMAEIPTILAGQEADADEDGETSGAEWQVYAERRAHEILPFLHLGLNGRALDLGLRNYRYSLKPGAAGLFILRLDIRYAAALPRRPGTAVLEYRDDYQPGQAGWKEVFLWGDRGVTVSHSSAPAHDRSKRLTEFAAAAGTAYPDELSARAELVIAAPQAQHAAPPAEPQAGDKAASVAAVAAAPHRESAGHRPPRDAVKPHRVQEVRSFFVLGMHHIATGWDHLVFLFGLLLLKQSALQLVKVVTAFTLAHSFTLALAFLGLVTPPSALIEPAIALTIAYVGLLNLARRQSVHGVLLAFAFGLVHGFGFAGALMETVAETSPPGSGWLLDLVSFNLGIEAFQLMLVCLAAPAIFWLRRVAWANLAHRVASLTVLGAGLGWFLARVLVEG